MTPLKEVSTAFSYDALYVVAIGTIKPFGSDSRGKTNRKKVTDAASRNPGCSGVGDVSELLMNIRRCATRVPHGGAQASARSLFLDG